MGQLNSIPEGTFKMLLAGLPHKQLIVQFEEAGYVLCLQQSQHQFILASKRKPTRYFKCLDTLYGVARRMGAESVVINAK